jgi:hypothetical protein
MDTDKNILSTLLGSKLQQYWKDYLSWWNGIHPRHARADQYIRTNKQNTPDQQSEGQNHKIISIYSEVIWQNSILSW